MYRSPVKTSSFERPEEKEIAAFEKLKSSVAEPFPRTIRFCCRSFTTSLFNPKDCVNVLDKWKNGRHFFAGLVPEPDVEVVGIHPN